MRRHWPSALGALGAASGTAAVVSVVVLGGSEPAFAGWSATPTPAVDLNAPAPSDCQAKLPEALAQGSWTQVATDVRGPYSMTVYESGTSLASCFTGPSFSTVQAESMDSSGMMVSVSGSAAGTHPPTGASSSGVRLSTAEGIDQMLVSHLSQAGNGPYSLAEGRLAPPVTAVTLVLSDGQDIAATTGSGWLVAWWPGSEDVTSVEVTTASGTTTSPLNTAVRLPLPAPSANGSGNVAVHSPSSNGPELSPTGNS